MPTWNVKDIINNSAREIGLEEVSTVVGASLDIQTKQLVRLMYRAGREVRERVEWPQLSWLATITLVAGIDYYTVPADFDSAEFRTFWDATNHWELAGPISAQEWMWRKYGNVSSAPRKRFRFKGANYLTSPDLLQPMFIDPVPTASEAGQTLAYEYQSVNWITPGTTWTASTVYAANAYVQYRGNPYKTTAGGTSGSTAPTHKSGSAGDGVVTWTFQPSYAAQADTDISLLDGDLISLNIQWRYLQLKGMEYAEKRQEFEDMMSRAAARIRGAKTLSAAGSEHDFLLGPRNIPDSGFGV